MSVFPTNLDTFTTKSNGDTLQSTHVNDLQDAVSALEAKVGVDGSSVATSLTKKVADLVTLLGSCTAADLQKLHDLTATALELNKLDVDNLTTGDLITKGASALEVISAVNATQYLKSAGTSTKPAYSKMTLTDTGLAVGSIDITNESTKSVSLSFNPSVVIFIGTDEKSTDPTVSGSGGESLSFGFDTGSVAKCIWTISTGSNGLVNFTFNDQSNSIHINGGNDLFTGKITSKSSSGFTITFSTTSNMMGATILYLALP